jgi:hypothetical protein
LGAVKMLPGKKGYEWPQSCGHKIF